MYRGLIAGFLLLVVVIAAGPGGAQGSEPEPTEPTFLHVRLPIGHQGGPLPLVLDTSGLGEDGCASLRVREAGQMVPVFIGSGCGTSTATVWVDLATSSAQQRLLRLSDDADQPSSAIDPAKFTFFDHFEGTELDLEAWHLPFADGIWSVADSVLTLHRPSNNDHLFLRVETLESFAGPVVIQSRFQLSGDDAQGVNGNVHYYTSWYLGGAGKISSLCHSVFPNYESSMYTGASYVPPRCNSAAATAGVPLPDPPLDAWQTDTFYVLPEGVARTIHFDGLEDADGLGGASSGPFGIHGAATSGTFGADTTTQVDWVLIQELPVGAPEVEVFVGCDALEGAEDVELPPECDTDDSGDEIPPPDQEDEDPEEIDEDEAEEEGDGEEPQIPDSDSDGVPDAMDNCPATPNLSQVDTDENGVGDDCESPVDPAPPPVTCDECVPEPPGICPTLLRSGVEMTVEPGTSIEHYVPLADGGTGWYRFDGRGLEHLPGMQFDAGTGGVFWKVPDVEGNEKVQHRGEILLLGPGCEASFSVTVVVRGHDEDEVVGRKDDCSFTFNKNQTDEGSGSVGDACASPVETPTTGTSTSTSTIPTKMTATTSRSPAPRTSNSTLTEETSSDAEPSGPTGPGSGVDQTQVQGSEEDASALAVAFLALAALVAAACVRRRT